MDTRTEADRAYTAAIHTARDEMTRATEAIDATWQMHRDAVWETYQAAVTEAQRAYDLATGTRLERTA